MKAILGLFSYGGVFEGTIDSVLGELAYCSKNDINMGYHRISGDALIERSRSRALGKFMRGSDADVIIMIDHDISWRPGDAAHTCQQAVENTSLVGGLYCKRAFKKGWASRVPHNGSLQFGKSGLLPTPALATGFMAIPRKLVEKLDEQLDITQPYWQGKFQEALDAKDQAKITELLDMSIAPIADGAYRKVDFEYKDYFRCIRYESNMPDTYQFLSEDWSFSIRAVQCGFQSYLSTLPILTHTGDHGYTVMDGMDDKDRGGLDGQKQDNGSVNDPNKKSGGDKVDVRNQCNVGGRDRPEPAGATRKARRRRKR